jgi:hypothetical protein
VPFHPIQDLIDSTSTPSAESGVPSAASAKKALPVFIIIQVALSGLIIAGALWLSLGDDMSKYDRLQDPFANVIPAKAKGHARYDSVASLGSDTVPFAELEEGRSMGHRRSESVRLASHGALMGISLRSGSMNSHEDENEAPFTRILDSRSLTARDRNSLFLE